ncbi:thioredoxin family protein [Maribellus sediminis]|uniref:thioredoxin family protein n=1 Tax=Maribellus sediminis TaxID=2696285 RepID=UPI00142FA9D0|nr:thioredoxin family protein [Maribellus sediminis]
MKNILFTLMILAFAGLLQAQDIKIYNPEANAKADIKAAVKEAAESGKHVFLQIGGNWCSWCIKFHQFVENDAEISEFVQNNFVVVKVNYDPKNKNEEVLSDLGYPQRFGFPVFVILDGNGNRIHTQNSAFLEKDKGYDRDRVLRFYKNWSPTALDPKSYK